MTEIINPNFYNEFGNLVEINLHKNNLILTGINLDNNNFNKLRIMFKKILLGQTYDVNILELNLILNNLTSINRNILLSYYLEEVYNITNIFYLKLDELIHNNYTNYYFKIMYDKYSKSIFELKKSLKIINDYLKNIYGSNILTIYANYIFYYLVINKTYQHNGTEKYLYKVFIDCIDNSLDDFMSLYKMYKYYKFFSESIKNNRELYFNKELDNIFTNNNEDLLELIAVDTDKNIKLLSSFKYINSTDKNEVKKLVEKTTDYIKMSLKLCDTSQFMTTYLKFLQKRIISRTVDPNIELEFSHNLSFNANKDDYIKIKYCIHDILSSDFITNQIKSLKNINFTSAKYLGFDKQTINLNKCRYSLLRKYAWEGSTYGKTLTFSNLQEPPEISFYTDVLTNFLNKSDFYSLKYKEKNINIDYENSETIIEFSINNNNYNIKCNLLQAIVIILINNNDNITAKQISDNLKISLRYLTETVNVLLKSTIIIRDKSLANNDKNNNFQINKSFYSNDVNICLLTVLDNYKEEIKNIQHKKYIDELNIANNNLLEFFSLNKNRYILSDEIEEHMKNTKLEIINDILNKFINSNILIKSNLGYYYSYSEIESDNESDEELDHNVDEHIIDDDNNTDQVDDNNTDQVDDNNIDQVDDNNTDKVNEHIIDQVDDNNIDQVDDNNTDKLDEHIIDKVDEHNTDIKSKYSKKYMTHMADQVLGRIEEILNGQQTD
jgi:hypothetical protein